jgi:hypothetical protein
MDFDPVVMLEEEKRRVETACSTGTLDDLLRIMPGKGRIPVPAQTVGMDVDSYIELINKALEEDLGNSDTLGGAIETVLGGVLPARDPI